MIRFLSKFVVIQIRLNCLFVNNVGGMLELSEAIRDYHDHIGLPQMVSLANLEYVLITEGLISGFWF